MFKPMTAQEKLRQEKASVIPSLKLKASHNGNKDVQLLHLEDGYMHSAVEINESNIDAIEKDLKETLQSINFLKESNVYDS